MNNKRLLNIYLLCVSLLSIVVFILPLEKITLESSVSSVFKISFYVINALIIIMLILNISLCIVNMFTEHFEGVKFSESLVFFSFALSVIVLIMFSVNLFTSLAWGYVLFVVLLFVLNSFNQIAKVGRSIKGFKKYFSALLPLNNKEKLVVEPGIGVKEMQAEKLKKTKTSKLKELMNKKENDKKVQVADTNLQANAQKPDIVSGEKE